MKITELIEKLQKAVDKLSKSRPNDDKGWWDEIFIEYDDKALEIDNVSLSGYKVKEKADNKVSYIGCQINLKDEVCEIPKCNDESLNEEFLNHTHSEDEKSICVATLLDVEEEI